MKWLTAHLLDPIRSRLFYKMLIIYSLLTLIPLIVVSSVFYLRSSLVVEKKAAEAAQQDLSGTADKIDEVLYAIKSQMMPISEDVFLQTLLRESNNGQEDQFLRASVAESLESELQTAKLKIGDFVSGIYVLTKSGTAVTNGTPYAPAKPNTASSTSPSTAPIAIDGSKPASTSDNIKVFYSSKSSKRLLYPKAYWEMPFEFDRMPEWAFFDDDGRFSCVVKIFDEGQRPSQDSETGRLVMTLDSKRLQALLAKFPSDKFFVTNADNLIMSASDPAKIGHVLDIRDPVKGIVIRQKSRYSEFQYIYLANPGTGGLVKQQGLFAIGVALAAWLAITIVTYVILRRVTIPIQRLTRLMRAAEREEYHTITGITTKDEIAMLCIGFNSLIERTSHLIETNYKNQLLIREAELKAIRMYINPHFLYNTMEYISIMSHSPEKAKYIPQMVQHLSGIFRFSITPGNAFVELDTEMEFVRKYLEIHSFRYGERLTYTIDLPDMYRKIAIPKLLLQPLVENAVVHGIDRLQEGGEIAISVKEEQYELVIEIANSSLPHGAEQENEAADPALKRRSRGLGSGLENVNSRLRLHYGNTYGVNLIREANTTITRVVMPIQILQENEEE